MCRFFHFYVFSILIDAYKILASADRYNTNNVCVINKLRIEGVVGKIEEDELVKYRLQEGISKLLGIAIDLEDIEEDYVGFIRDEIQGEAIPDYVLDVLAEPVMAESFGYRDGKNDYYEVCHLYYVGTKSI